MRLVKRLARRWLARSWGGGEVEAATSRGGTGTAAPGAAPVAAPLTPGSPAPDCRGWAPDGAPIELAMAGRTAILVFLTSTCRECRPVWQGGTAAVAAGARGAPGETVLITPDPSTESRRSVAALAPADLTTVMSSAAWHAYGVTGAPWVVTVAGGVVTGSRPLGAGRPG